MSEHRILRLKPALRLERRGQHGQNKTDERDHRTNLADSSLNKPGWGFRHTQRSGMSALRSMTAGTSRFLKYPGRADMLRPPSNRRSCAKNRKSRRFDMDKASEASLLTHRPPSGPDEPHARQHGYAFLSLRRQALHQPLAAPKLIGPFPAAILPIQQHARFEHVGNEQVPDDETI
jgi:hypothetical protein